MNAQLFRSWSAAALLVTAIAFSLLGCFGSGDEPTVTTMSVAANEQTIPVATTTTVVGEGSAPVTNEDLSTFKSKDPFIPQAVVTTTTIKATTTTKPGTTTTTKAGTTTTTHATTTTTTHATTTTTPSTTTTTLATTTTTHATTTTTAPYRRSMRLDSIDGSVGSPAVTITVEGVTRTNMRVGDPPVPTPWGEWKVVVINFTGEWATFLHGSESVTVRLKQTIYE
jgi:hypothetical protein